MGKVFAWMGKNKQGRMDGGVMYKMELNGKIKFCPKLD